MREAVGRGRGARPGAGDGHRGSAERRWVPAGGRGRARVGGALDRVLAAGVEGARSGGGCQAEVEAALAWAVDGGALGRVFAMGVEGAREPRRPWQHAPRPRGGCGSSALASQGSWAAPTASRRPASSCPFHGEYGPENSKAKHRLEVGRSLPRVGESHAALYLAAVRRCPDQKRPEPPPSSTSSNEVGNRLTCTPTPTPTPTPTHTPTPTRSRGDDRRLRVRVLRRRHPPPVLSHAADAGPSWRARSRLCTGGSGAAPYRGLGGVIDPQLKATEGESGLLDGDEAAARRLSCFVHGPVVGWGRERAVHPR